MASTTHKHHDYHMVDPSPWPALASLGAFFLLFGAVALFRFHGDKTFIVFGANLATPWIFYIGLAIVLYTMYAWWSDTIRESRQGAHTPVVSMHLRYGMIMFIASEVMFFVAWFWAFFDASLFPGEAIQAARVQALGGVWPPKGIEVLDPLHLPLFNTVTLLLSGTTVTWAHHAMLEDDRKSLITGLALTVAWVPSSPSFSISNMPMRPSRSKARSTARPSSWRRASMVSTSSSA